MVLCLKYTEIAAGISSYSGTIMMMFKYSENLHESEGSTCFMALKCVNLSAPN